MIDDNKEIEFLQRRDGLPTRFSGVQLHGGARVERDGDTALVLGDAADRAVGNYARFRGPICRAKFDDVPCFAARNETDPICKIRQTGGVGKRMVVSG